MQPGEPFANQLELAGFGAWNELAKLWEIRDVFAGVLGEGRVLIGCDGFNTVGHQLARMATST